MDFLEDIFETRGKNSRQNLSGEAPYPLRNQMNRLLQSRKIMGWLIVAAVLVLVLCIILGILAVTHLGPILAYMQKNGINGVLEYFLPFLQKIWEGSK